MMQAKLLGIQEINFTNDAGISVNGINIFCAFKDENTEGLRTEKFFLKDGITLPKEIKINDTLDIVFTRKGKVEMIYKAN